MKYNGENHMTVAEERYLSKPWKCVCGSTTTTEERYCSAADTNNYDCSTCDNCPVDGKCGDEKMREVCAECGRGV